GGGDPIRRNAASACLAFLSCLAAATAQEKSDKPDRAALEKQFAEKMSNAKMVGSWSLWGKEDKPMSDKYTLGKVTHIEGDNWTFEARIQYGKIDTSYPVPVQVKWAGDTPVITVDKLTIPLLGKFSARVVIDGDHYAATWDGGDHGGYMWGKVIKGAKEEPKGREKSKDKDSEKAKP